MITNEFLRNEQRHFKLKELKNGYDNRRKICYRNIWH